MEDGDVALGFLPKDRSMFGRGCEMPGPRYSGCSHLELGADAFLRHSADAGGGAWGMGGISSTEPGLVGKYLWTF